MHSIKRQDKLETSLKIRPKQKETKTWTQRTPLQKRSGTENLIVCCSHSYLVFLPETIETVKCCLTILLAVVFCSDKNFKFYHMICTMEKIMNDSTAYFDINTLLKPK